MNTQIQPAFREHHFYVATAKFLFHHPEHGIVSVRDPISIKDAECYGLRPLILYGLTVAGLPIRWMTFSALDQLRPLREVLMTAWRNAIGLRGHPDILRMNRHLAMASPELAKDLEAIGVRVVVADAREKSLPASLRSTQDASRWLMRQAEGTGSTLTGSIQTLCQDAQNNHDFYVSDRHRSVRGLKAEASICQWLDLPARKPVSLPVAGRDWEAGLWLSSWEASLPPAQPRYFDCSGFCGGTWLLTGENPPVKLDDDEELWPDTDYDNVPEIVRNLVACWPNPPVEVARSAGITLRELQWFSSGKASLDWQARDALEALLGIEYDDRLGEYIGAGPYVLVASKQQPLQAVYDALTGGGDACPCEIVPRQGVADPSWRYVLILRYDAPPSIVMASRGANITERLPALLRNFEESCPVPPDFYRDVVTTCARACREPAANMREMRDFAQRYANAWRDCFWQPE